MRHSGATRSVEPGIHNYDRAYGFRARAKRARPGMTTEILASNCAALQAAKQKPRHRCRGFALKSPERMDQKSMPPMPPPEGMPPAAPVFFFAISAHPASPVTD